MNTAEMVNIIDEICEVILARKILNKFTKIYKKLYEELQTEGFTEEQAMKIIVNYRPGGTN